VALVGFCGVAGDRDLGEYGQEGERLMDLTSINLDWAQNQIRLVNADPSAPANFLRQIAPLESNYQLLCESYASLSAVSSPEIAYKLIQAGVAIAKGLNWPVVTLKELWLIWAQMLSVGVVREYEWSEMTKILDVSSIAARAFGVGITEDRFKKAIAMGVVRAETFLPAFAELLQAEFKDGD
jgi:hypothetical protein